MTYVEAWTMASTRPAYLENGFGLLTFGHQAPERQGTPNAHPPTSCASALDLKYPPA